MERRIMKEKKNGSVCYRIMIIDKRKVVSLIRLLTQNKISWKTQLEAELINIFM